MALAGSPWLAPLAAVVSLAAVAAGAVAGAAWDAAVAAVHHYYAPGAHRR